MGGLSAFLNCTQKPPLPRKRKGGQALIEAAIAVPLVILLIVVCVDLGRLVYSKIALTNAAREAAYFLSYHPEASDADATAVARLETLATGISYTSLSASSGGTCCTVDQPVTVTVTATLNGFILLDSLVSSNPVTMMVMK